MLMKYRLFTPGPTSVPEATLLELAKPVHHHRTAEFRAMFNEVQATLQYVYQTKNTVYTITGSGTAAAEAGIVNALAPGQKALCVTNGKFAERWSAGLHDLRHRAQGPEARVRRARHARADRHRTEGRQVRRGHPRPLRDQHRHGLRSGRHRQGRPAPAATRC